MRKTMVLLALMLIQMKSFAQSPSQSPIQYEDAYSVYIVKDLRASRDFYIRWLDFEVIFEASWFVYFQSKGEHKVSLALIDENHPSDPPSYAAFDSTGSFLTFQVRDASAVYQKLKSMGAPITYDLKKEDWGQLRFGLTDPNGLYIDIVQQIEPVAGYWDQYVPEK